MASLQFPGAYAVLIKVVGVGFFHGEVGVGVVLPAAAEIEYVINAAYLVTAREGQPQGIVLAIACVWHAYVAQQRGVECARSAEAVDTQGIVAAVVGGPFLVVDYAGGLGWRLMSVSMYVPTTMPPFCS